MHRTRIPGKFIWDADSITCRNLLVQKLFIGSPMIDGPTIVDNNASARGRSDMRRRVSCCVPRLANPRPGF